jgi:uncharacterized protein YjiS (DUF1127 family)
MLNEPRLHLASMSADHSDGARPAPKIGFLRWFQKARDIQHRRRQLAELPPLMLEDMGIDPSEAAYEASRPFGDFPRTWLR